MAESVVPVWRISIYASPPTIVEVDKSDVDILIRERNKDIILSHVSVNSTLTPKTLESIHNFGTVLLLLRTGFRSQ